jgi:hypothetical protein
MPMNSREAIWTMAGQEKPKRRPSLGAPAITQATLPK